MDGLMEYQHLCQINPLIKYVYILHSHIATFSIFQIPYNIICACYVYKYFVSNDKLYIYIYIYA